MTRTKVKKGRRAFLRARTLKRISTPQPLIRGDKAPYKVYTLHDTLLTAIQETSQQLRTNAQLQPFHHTPVLGDVKDVSCHR